MELWGWSVEILVIVFNVRKSAQSKVIGNGIVVFKRGLPVSWVRVMIFPFSIVVS